MPTTDITTYYMRITALQNPIAIGTDVNGARSMFSCNYVASCVAPVPNFEEDIITLLGSDIAPPDSYVFGRTAILPTTGDGPFIRIIPTGGMAPEISQDGTIYPTLTAQVVTYHKSYVASRAQANLVWAALANVSNVAVTTTITT